MGASEALVPADTRAPGTQKPIKALSFAPLPAGRYRLRRCDRYSLKLHTIGTYTQEADAQADRVWWEAHDREGTFIVQ